MDAAVALGDTTGLEEGSARRGPRWLRAAAGPALIGTCVLFALRGFAFSPLLSNQHPDLLSFWLPRFSFLGRSLAAGHVPLWNPFEMTGTRYLADPQSGWLYAAPMLLFSPLSPGAAMRAFIVFDPLLAGLGAYWFLRKEQLPRVAATAGGLALAMPMATSITALAMPFAGAIAWTTLVLVGASGYRQAERPAGRLAWLGFAALAWSQVASAHMSHGLGMATLLVAAYLTAWGVAAVRTREKGLGRAAAEVAGFLAFLPLASLAVFLPRLAMISSSSLHAGYGALAEERPAGLQDLAIKANGVWAAWPLALGSAPGAFAGAVSLLSIPLALRSRRFAPLVWAFGLSSLLTYALTLSLLVTAGWFRALVLKVPYGDVYLHNPGRLRYVWMMAAPVLGAIGIAALLERPPGRATLLRWLGAGTAIFLAIPLVMGGNPVRFVTLAIGIAAATPVFLATGRRWGPVALVGLLSLELVGSAVYSQVYQGGTIYTGLEGGDHPNLVPQVLRWPDVPEQAFLRPTAFVRILEGTQDRYLTWVQPAAYFEKGYLFAQDPRDWPALTMERGTLFGIHDVLGYNPVQLVRYWSYVRETNRLSVFYNASVINEPTLADVRLLGVRYLIVPVGQSLPPGLTGLPVATADGYDLVEVDGWEPRVSVVPEWTVASGPDAAFRVVVDPGFDPAQEAVLEADPGIQPLPGGRPGSASYAEVTPEDVRVTVDALAPSIVLVRNDWDAGWTATVDGKPAPVLPADGFRQGVPVAPGPHEIRLRYRDPTIGRGLAASAVVWGLWAAGLGLALRRRRPPSPATSPA
ncbi:MAG: hypothetical protein HY240_02090 [Actinobacteria bacterium]|nr:hypothetical protein [Actinomycetota bacterium]